MGPTWPFLRMYRSHEMRHTGFRKLMVVNETPGFWAITLGENIANQKIMVLIPIC